MEGGRGRGVEGGKESQRENEREDEGWKEGKKGGGRTSQAPNNLTKTCSEREVSSCLVLPIIQ